MGTLKNALTALFNSNNYTPSTSGITSKKIPVTETSGLPSGQISMENLLSVLGSYNIAPLTSTDLNDVSITCMASAGQNETENMPTTNNYYIVPTFVCRRLFRLQIAAQILSPYKIFYRTYNPSNSEATRWSAWKEIAIVSQ